MNDDDLEEITVQAYRSGTARFLDSLRAAISDHVLNLNAARSLAASASAHLVAYKLGQVTSDLLLAARRMGEAVALDPTPARQANLASCLLELNDVADGDLAAGRQARHTRALGLLRHALDGTDPASGQWVTRSTTYVGALIDAVTINLPSADVESMLVAARHLVAAAEILESDGGEPYNLLGMALLAAAARGHPRVDLAEAVDALRRAVDATPAGHIDRSARLSNLGSALMDLYERGGDTSALARSVDAHSAALAAVDVDDHRYPMMVNNLVNTLMAEYRRSGDGHGLDRARSLLDTLLSVPPEDLNFGASRSNAGLVRFEVAQRTRTIEDAQAAVQAHADAVNAAAGGLVPHPAVLAGRVQSLANAVMLRYELTGDADDLDTVLRLGEQALALADDAPHHEQAIFMSTLGTALHERFMREGRITDLENSARLQLAAVGGLHGATPFQASLLNNASVSLADRYDRLGDMTDLHAAIDALRQALAAPTSPPHERAARLSNLALNLTRLYERDGDNATLRTAVDAAEDAHATALSAEAHVPLATSIGVLTDLSVLQLSTPAKDAALQRIQQLWAGDSSSAARLTAEPAALLRRALLSARIPALGDRHDLLLAAAERGLERRPAVTVTAARQLAIDGLVQQAAGRADGRSVEAAAEFGAAGLAALTHTDDALRHGLSWRGEARGIAAALAHSRALSGDAPGALAAYEAGHAVLLSTRTNRSSSPVNPDLVGTDDILVTAWTTPVGGAAVIHHPDRQPVLIDLPHATTDAAAEWTRTLGKASRMGRGAITAALRRVLNKVTTAVTAPISGHLTPGAPITWISAGVLSAVPIDAARSADGIPLGRRHPIRHAPTAAIAATSRQRATTTTLNGPWFSIGSPAPSRYPPLPGAAHEMTSFSDDQHRYLAERATPDHATTAVQSGALVHFACHARTTAADPLMNHLLLASDEEWFADQVTDLTTRARLVVLSACDTASPGGVHADESLGLPGAFIAAGAAGVIASLWSVADETTGRMMTHLADKLRSGSDPRDALTAARNHIRGDDEVVAAAFHLFGA